MPNHISNIIRLSTLDNDWKRKDEAFEALKALMKTEEGEFDFDVLIPYPEPYKSLDDARNEAEKQLEGLPKEEYWQRRMQLPKDGFNAGGYEWCIANWGTKWNAYDIGFGYEEVAFCTAWATPKPIWVALSQRFPDMRLEVEYADEDLGANCGKLVYANGKTVLFEDMSKRPDSTLFARAIIAEQKAMHSKTELERLRKPPVAVRVGVSQ